MERIKKFTEYTAELNEAYGYSGKWMAIQWGKMPGAPKSEIINTQRGFRNHKEANKWASKQPGGIGTWDILPEEGWIDPAGTWHPDDDDYDPASAYESVNEIKKAPKPLDTNSLTKAEHEHLMKLTKKKPMSLDKVLILLLSDKSSMSTGIAVKLAPQLNIKESINEREFSEKDREKLASANKALPDGSFPIETIKDLENAIQAHGRAKDPDKAKNWIIKRAKEMGKEDILPDGWN